MKKITPMYDYFIGEIVKEEVSHDPFSGNERKNNVFSIVRTPTKSGAEKQYIIFSNASEPFYINGREYVFFKDNAIVGEINE